MMTRSGRNKIALAHIMWWHVHYSQQHRAEVKIVYLSSLSHCFYYMVSGSFNQGMIKDIDVDREPF